MSEPDPPLRDVQLHLVDSVDDAVDLLRWLGERGHDGEIGLDTETSGLDKHRDRVRLAQVGDSRHGWAIPWERWGGVLVDVVRRFEGTYVLHNATFDWQMLAKEGVVLPRERIHDTRLMLHVLTSTGSLALKTAAQKYVDPLAAAGQDQLQTGVGRDGGWTWANVPPDYAPYWLYGALDPVLTRRLKREVYPLVEADAPLSYELEMQVLWTCVAMELKGAALDQDYTRQLADQLRAYQDEVEAWVRTHYGFAPGSDAKLIDQLLRDGVVLTKRTQGGRLSVDKEVLEELDHPLGQAVLGRRRAQKMVGYLQSYLDLVGPDGRLHPNINTVGGTDRNMFESGGSRGVRTGRMSMDRPNLQNVPIRSKAGKRIRNCFVPRCDERCGCGEEHVWIKLDADQIEMRILAHLAEDPKLIDAFNQPVDVFTAAARDIFQEPELAKGDARRQRVKNGFYAIDYGAGLEQFARTAGIRDPVNHQLDLVGANAFLHHLHARYPGIKRLQQRVEQEGLSRLTQEGVAYVRSPLTRRRHTADANRSFTLLNYCIQGTAGEILKMKMVEAAHAGLGEFMMFPVHDEVDLDLPASRLPEVLAQLDEVMNDRELLAVPITWTADHGERWGECG